MGRPHGVAPTYCCFFLRVHDIHGATTWGDVFIPMGDACSGATTWGRPGVTRFALTPGCDIARLQRAGGMRTYGALFFLGT